MNNKAISVQATSFDINKAVTFSKLFQKVALSPATRLVLRCLIDCWNPNKGLVFPGQGFIADATGVTLRSVSTSIVQLKDAGLILTTRKQTHLNYYFTQKFFEMLNISYQMRKNCVTECEKFAYPYNIEQKRNKEKNKNEFSFFKTDEDKSETEKSIPPQKADLSEAANTPVFVTSFKKPNYPQGGFIPPQLKGATYQRFVPPDMGESKSPSDDYDTAVSWLSSLGESELKLSFIREKARKVREIWGL